MTDFHLETERLIIRNWQEKDRELFHFINSDDTVMEFFPLRRNRQQSDQLMDKLHEGIKRDGHGFTAIEEKVSGKCLGFCGLHKCDLEPIIPAGSIEIGWRLAPQFWGKGYVTEAAQRLMQFGFQDMNLDEIISFAVESNNRSFAVMKRIGMIHDPSRDFDYPGIPDTHPQIKPHLFYYAESSNQP